MAYLPDMLGRSYKNQNCSAAWTLELVGERWSLLILRDAMFAGATRFSEFQKSLGIATNILAKRLDDFVDSGLMRRRPLPNGSDQVEYVLTSKGMDLKPVIIALTQWGDRWVKPGPVQFRDRAKGRIVEVQLRAVEDDGRIAATDIVVAPRS